MAMNPSTLATAIEGITANMRAQTDQATSDKMYAQQLAAAIYAFILTAEVPAGIPVSTAGSPTSQTGATTGPGSLL